MGNVAGDRTLRCLSWDRVLFLFISSFLCVATALLSVQVMFVTRELHNEQAEIDRLKGQVLRQQNTTSQIDQKVEKEHSLALYHLAGTFTLLGGLITLFHMASHLRHFNEPFVQRKILAILIMCPIYSFTSFLSLVFPAVGPYLTIIKDLYESYVIYQFLSFLIAVLGKGDRDAVVSLLARHADHLKPPMKCLNSCFSPDPHESPEAMANAVLLECQVFAMQFVLFRPLTSISMFVLDMLDEAGTEMPMWDPRYPRFYVALIENISVFLAFAGLLKFYHVVCDDLKWCRPWPKFLCIKGVVFMTFWQGLAISLLANYFNRIKSGGEEGRDFDPRLWASSVQELLVCLEMMIFAIAHFFVFPTEEWEEGYRPKESKAKFGDSLALGDFVSDVRYVFSSKSSKDSGRRTEEAYLQIDGSPACNEAERTFERDDLVLEEEAPELGEQEGAKNL